MNAFKDIKYKTNIREIKSSFIIKIIFSFLSEKQKLNIIMHNREIQNILSVNIENYIKIYGKYIVGGKNGKRKEYLLESNILIFEGEYLNRKRNGKCKEYNKDGVLIFEGEYLNGERNGKGKEYDNNGLIFKGEYLNGKRWNGEGYNKNGIKEFEIKNGKGNGKIYDYNGELIYEGDYLNGIRWFGKIYNKNNNIIYI